LDEVKKVLTNQVKKQPEFPGMNLLSSFVYQNALIDLKDALQNSPSSGLIAMPKS
jgi:putative transposase